MARCTSHSTRPATSPTCRWARVAGGAAQGGGRRGRSARRPAAPCGVALKLRPPPLARARRSPPRPPPPGRGRTRSSASPRRSRSWCTTSCAGARACCGARCPRCGGGGGRRGARAGAGACAPPRRGGRAASRGARHTRAAPSPAGVAHAVRRASDPQGAATLARRQAAARRGGGGGGFLKLIGNDCALTESPSGSSASQDAGAAGTPGAASGPGAAGADARQQPVRRQPGGGGGRGLSCQLSTVSSKRLHTEQMMEARGARGRRAACCIAALASCACAPAAAAKPAPCGLPRQRHPHAPRPRTRSRPRLPPGRAVGDPPQPRPRAACRAAPLPGGPECPTDRGQAAGHGRLRQPCTRVRAPRGGGGAGAGAGVGAMQPRALPRSRTGRHRLPVALPTAPRAPCPRTLRARAAQARGRR